MTTLAQRVDRLEGSLPPCDGDDQQPDLIRVIEFGDGREERMYMRHGIVFRIEHIEPDPAA